VGQTCCKARRGKTKLVGAAPWEYNVCVLEAGYGVLASTSSTGIRKMCMMMWIKKLHAVN